jgi:hypothetical protein
MYYDVYMQILPKEDADAGQIVLESLLQDGVVFVFNCKFIRIEHAPPTADQVNTNPHECMQTLLILHIITYMSILFYTTSAVYTRTAQYSMCVGLFRQQLHEAFITTQR